MARVRARIFLLASVSAAVAGAAGGCGGHLGPRPAGGGGGAGDEGGGVSTGEGGAAGGGGTLGASGATGTGGTASVAHFGEPACAPAVTSGGACTAADLQFCYKPCGPEGVGVKSETCQSSGLYTEMVGCSYDLARDYSCYRIPSEPDARCPTGPTPQAGRPCDVPACTPCNNRGGVVGGEFASGGGAISEGWCVCQTPNAGGARIWSCTNDTQWPCPIGRGC
jgi:hypothetical protein